MKATVIPGQVEVNNVTCVVRGENFAVLQIDCMHKHPDVVSYSSSSGHELTLHCTERTPQPYDHEAPGTTVVLPEEFREWHVMLDWAKYTVYIALYRRPVREDVQVLWQADREGSEDDEAVDVRGGSPDSLGGEPGSAGS